MFYHYMSHITAGNFILPDNLKFVHIQYLVFYKINHLTFSSRYALSCALTFHTKNNAPAWFRFTAGTSKGIVFKYLIIDKIPQKALPEHMPLHECLLLYIPPKEAGPSHGFSESFRPLHSQRSSPDKFCGCAEYSQ